MICSLYVIKYTQSEKIYPRNTLFVTYLSSITSSIIYIMHTITRLRLKKKKIYYLIYYLYHAHKHAPSAENPENVQAHIYIQTHTHTHTHTHTQTSCAQSRGFGWHIQCGIEVYSRSLLTL
jgi:predicted S18 family serine protease